MVLRALRVADHAVTKDAAEEHLAAAHAAIEAVAEREASPGLANHRELIKPSRDQVL